MNSLASSFEPSAVYPILVVDDERQIFDLLNQIAESEFPQGNFVYKASYEEAIAYLTHVNGWLPRLIILDIDLKASQSGLDILSWVRASDAHALVPVVILSVVHEESIVRAAYARGANMFTNKPFSLDEWRNYIHFLRNYWFELATTPKLWQP